MSENVSEQTSSQACTWKTHFGDKTLRQIQEEKINFQQIIKCKNCIPRNQNNLQCENYQPSAKK